MYVDRNQLEEYPFDGVFYTIDEVKSTDGDPLADTTPSENKILETKCDIQESNKSFLGGTILSGYNIYFPFEKETGINIKQGDKFRCVDFLGVSVYGTVVGLFPTQLDGCGVFIKTTDL